jgi:hypothetical protein
VSERMNREEEENLVGGKVAKKRTVEINPTVR